MPGEMYGGFADLRDGMNSTRHPFYLTDTQYAKGINISVRTGMASTRPALVPLGISIPAGEFQGAGVWSLNSGDRLVMVVSGKVYVVVLDSGTVHNFGVLRDTSAQCFFCQVDKYMVVQDGVNTATVLEDVSGVPALYAGTHSIPIGYTMIFAHGRLHLVAKELPNWPGTEGRASIVSGNVLLVHDPSSVLQFTEVEYFAGGGANGLPGEFGFVGGLGVFRNAPTGTGFGEVLAIARHGVCSFDFSISRDYWQTQSLSKVLYEGPGTKSAWSVVSLNDDVLYREPLGIRLVRYTGGQTAAGSGILANVPMTVPVEGVFDTVGLPRVSAAAAGNRALMTIYGKDAATFRGLLAWDVAGAYYSGAAQTTGAFDGFWTGLDFKQVLRARVAEEPVIIVVGAGPVLYRTDETAVYDGTNTPIEARLETGMVKFASAGAASFDTVSKKQLKYVELRLGNVRCDTDVTVYYRPHGYPLWTQLGTRVHAVPAGSMSQGVRRLRIALDTRAPACDPVSGESLYTGTAFQFAVQWTGRATVELMRVVVEPMLESPPKVCDSAGTALTASEAAGIELDDFSYRIGS